MKKYLAFFATLIAVSSPSFAVVAFGDIDIDNDKSISLEEATAYESLSSAFAVLDTDADGMISTVEFEDFDQTAGLEMLEESDESEAPAE